MIEDSCSLKTHELPEWYLRGFVRNEGKKNRLTLFEVTQKKPRGITVREAMRHASDISFLKRSALGADLVKGFGDLRKSWLQMVDDLSAGRPFRREHLVTAYRVMAWLLVEKPALRSIADAAVERQRQMSQDEYDSLRHAEASEDEMPAKVEDAVAMVERPDFRERYMANFLMDRMDEFVAAFQRRNWAVMRADQSAGSFCTGYPVVYRDGLTEGASPRHNIRTPNDLLEADTVIYFPLSSAHCLMGVWIDPGQQTFSVDREDVAVMNFTGVSWAYRYVFARDSDFPVFDRGRIVTARDFWSTMNRKPVV